MACWSKRFIVISGFLEALVFSGCLFGWPSLLLILQEESVYSNFCVADVAVGTTGSLNADKSLKDNHLFGESRVDKANAVSLDTTLFGSGGELISSEPFDESHSTTEFQNLKPHHNNGNRSLAKNDGVNGYSPYTQNTEHRKENLLGCDEQRVQMTLIYTFAAVAYGLTAVLIGLSLDVLGLCATRLLGTSMALAGFIFLAYCTPDKSYFLWPALNLIALGTNQLRLSGFQFAELWPDFRATILSAYSSAYSISTTFFLVIQLFYEHGVSTRLLFLCSAGLCALTYIPTVALLISGVIISRSEDDSESNKADEENNVPRVIKNQLKSNNPSAAKPEEIPLSNLNSQENSAKEGKTKPSWKNVMASLFSLSGVFHMYWHFINMFLVFFYSSTLNIWVSKVNPDIHQESFIIKMSGLCCLIAPVFVPVVGFVTDKMIGRAEMRATRVERLAYTMQAPTFAMTGATIVLSLTMICKLFLTETAIYLSLILIALSRPAVVGSCTTYIRMRFPSEEFNMLNGTFTTIISILCFVVYPVLKWITSSTVAYYQAHWLLLLILIGSLVSPFHMMIRRNIMRYAKQRLERISNS